MTYDPSDPNSLYRCRAEATETKDNSSYRPTDEKVKQLMREVGLAHYERDRAAGECVKWMDRYFELKKKVEGCKKCRVSEEPHIVIL